MAGGIVSWGAYVPIWRLKRTAIGLALEGPSGRGTRAVASYDEDTTTMAVEAARVALRQLDLPAPSSLLFSTPSPAYADKTNATAIHAALGLDRACGAYDVCGASRSSVAAVGLGRRSVGDGACLVTMSDLRTGLAGSADERDGGDGAVAFVFANHGAVAEVVAEASTSAEFLDRWRAPGEVESKQWEERFGEQLYVPLGRDAFADACKEAGIEADQIGHVIVTGLHARAVKAVASRLGVRDDAVVASLVPVVGNLGAAASGIALADILDRAEPGALIATLGLADGADATIWRVTDAIVAARAARADANVPAVAVQIEAGRDDLSYQRFLTWRGQLRRDPPRRPEPERPGAPSTRRSDPWKYGFNASRCRACGFRHLPPTRRCLQCKAIDDMELERLADVEGTIATYTVDRLAFSMSPPVVGVVVDFDGGGRYRCEMADADLDTLEIGTRVRMAFRRMSITGGIHNYFWKARPIPASVLHEVKEDTRDGE
ncbi:MAG: OB-fold domain-containing protein [Acidimicrobiales bacterium]